MGGTGWAGAQGRLGPSQTMGCPACPSGPTVAEGTLSLTDSAQLRWRQRTGAPALSSCARVVPKLRPAPQTGHPSTIAGLTNGPAASPGSQEAGGAWGRWTHGSPPHRSSPGLGSGLLPRFEMRLPGVGRVVPKPEGPWPGSRLWDRAGGSFPGSSTSGESHRAEPTPGSALGQVGSRLVWLPSEVGLRAAGSTCG